MGPLSTMRQKRIQKAASKPTAIAKITTRPYINPQTQSPLFSTLPAEIRFCIFDHALLAYPDLSRPYSRHTFWYRPGYTHARAVATNLLLTCRRIYLETDLLPLQLNEHTIWGVERSRRPPGTNAYLSPNNPFLKTVQRNTIQNVHLFVQQSWLEDWRNEWLAFSKSWPNGCPKRLRITIRHTDWWYNMLGENSPMAIDPKRKGRAALREWVDVDSPCEKDSWGSRFENFCGLETFELELETIEQKISELEANLMKASGWRLPLGDAKVLLLDEGSTVKSRWSGSKHFKGLDAAGVPAYLQLRRPSLRKADAKNEIELENAELTPEDLLNYYVVLLTWRARDAPKAEESEDRREDESVSVLSTSDGSTNASIAATPPPATVPRASFNRRNAVPTFYG